MSLTRPDSRQIIHRAALATIGAAAGTTQDSLNSKFNTELNVPLRLAASFPTPDAKLNFADSLLSSADGGKKVMPPLSSQVFESLTGAFINFQTQALSNAAHFTITFPSSTVGLFRRAGFTLTSAGKIQVLFSAEAASEGALANAGTVIVDGIPLGYVNLVGTVTSGTGLFKTAGSATSIIENAKIYHFAAGGAGSSSSGSGTGSDLMSLQYQAEFVEGYNNGISEGPSSSLNSIDTGAGKTDSTAYDTANKMYALNYDASKTIAAGTTTTNINISANASFTVKTGDMVIYGSQARRITAVSTQASFTCDAFDVAPTLAGQVTISQAVHTLDIYNLQLGKNSLADDFGAATFNDILVDYKDSNAASDNVFDINVAPGIAYDASHNGTSFTNFTARPTLQSSTWSNLVLNGSGTSLYLRFFANKTSGTGVVNLLGFIAKMQKDVSVSSGGVTWSAMGMTDQSATPVNCSISEVGGKTAITLTNSLVYALGVASGSPYGSLDVYLDGVLIPRFINSTLTPDSSYTETSNTVITLDRSYNSQQLSIFIIQRTANLPIDTTTTNTTALNTLNTHLFKNYIINGAFDFWQRATSFSTPATATYTSDRWRHTFNGTSGTFTISRQAFTLGQTDVPNEPTYFLRWAQTVAGSGNTIIQLTQRIESVRSLAGKNVTVTFWAKADTSRSVSVLLTQNFGTGGSPSSTVNTSTTAVNLTTVWQKFIASFAIPSISGKTLGTNGDDCLELRLQLPVNTTMTMDFAQVMVNEGAAAAPWVYASGGSSLNFQAELALCQRYCWQVSDTQYLGSGYFDTTTSSYFSLKFPVPMRAAPTMSTNVASAFNVERASSSASTSTGNSFSGTGVLGTRVNITGTSASTVGFGSMFNLAGGNYVRAEAEL